ncbi:hypothetical protein M5K25_005038 [Dendrobium thyrsiflorum]|uniref:Uncharacterized protein n=1 Tax=Dendrobium thyrsiflorum TaxID=117978 RepID=A0ABD0VGM7_DENTH
MSEISKLNALLNEKDAILMEISKELQERPTAKVVEDLCKQIKTLQVIGYNSMEVEDWELATKGQEMSKMETLLLNNNKKMEHKLT